MTTTPTFLHTYKKPIRALGFGVARLASQADAAIARIDAYATTPDDDKADGSLALNEGGVPHVRIGGAWYAVAVAGQTFDSGSAGIKADVIAESTAATGVTVDGVLVKDGGITLASGARAYADIISEATSAAGVTVDGCLIKDGRAAALATAGRFLSTEQTGTGSEQDIAHGLASTPTFVFVVPSDLTGGAFTVAYGTHDGTNCKVTATSGEKYRVVAYL